MKWYKASNKLSIDSGLGIIAQKSKQPRHAVIALWHSMLEYCSRKETGGCISSIDFEEIAYQLEMDIDVIAKILDEMIARDWLSDGKVVKWKDYQRDPTNAERQKRHREKNNNNQDDKDTVTVTNSVVTESNTQRRGEEKREEKKKKDKKEISIPDFIEKELWDGFVEMRVKENKPMTDLAKKKILEKLARFVDDGYSANKSLEYSITGNYPDVYQPKQKETKQGKLQEVEGWKKKLIDAGVGHHEVSSWFKSASLEGNVLFFTNRLEGNHVRNNLFDKVRLALGGKVDIEIK